MCNSHFRPVPGFTVKRIATILIQITVAVSLEAQQTDHDMSQMGPDMQMPGMNMTNMNAPGMFLMNLASGTSANPAAWPMPMVVTHLGSWNSMFMANAFLADIQQSGPRGGDKLYSTNWFMASAEHSVGSNGAFEAVLMLSLEPATITDRRYLCSSKPGKPPMGCPSRMPSIRIISSWRWGSTMLFAERRHHTGSLLCPGRRPRHRTRRLSPPRLGIGAPRSAAFPSFAGLDAHRLRRGNGRRLAQRVQTRSVGIPRRRAG